MGAVATLDDVITPDSVDLRIGDGDLDFDDDDDDILRFPVTFATPPLPPPPTSVDEVGGVTVIMWTAMGSAATVVGVAVIEVKLVAAGVSDESFPVSDVMVVDGSGAASLDDESGSKEEE